MKIREGVSADLNTFILAKDCNIEIPIDDMKGRLRFWAGQLRDNGIFPTASKVRTGQANGTILTDLPLMCVGSPIEETPDSETPLDVMFTPSGQLFKMGTVETEDGDFILDASHPEELLDDEYRRYYPITLRDVMDHVEEISSDTLKY